MKLKKVTRYITPSGHMFDDEKIAKEFIMENKISNHCHEKLHKLLSASYIDMIVQHRKAIFAVLTEIQNMDKENG